MRVSLEPVHAFYLALSGIKVDLNFPGRDRDDRSLKFCRNFLKGMARCYQKRRRFCKKSLCLEN